MVASSMMKTLLATLTAIIFLTFPLAAQNDHGQFLLSRFGDIYAFEPEFEIRLNLTPEQQAELAEAYTTWQQDPDVEAAFADFQASKRTDLEDAKKAAWNAKRGEARKRFVEAYQRILSEDQLRDLHEFEELYRRLNVEARNLVGEDADRPAFLAELRRLWIEQLGPIGEHQVSASAANEPAAETTPEPVAAEETSR